MSAQVDPSEDYIVFRTVADLLGGTVPVSRSTIDGQAKCLLFDRNGRSVMLVWDEYAPPEGRDHVLWVGENAQQVDLWGVRRPLATVGKKRLVRIGPVPTFVVNAPTWLMEFCRQFILAPPVVEFSFDAYERTMTFRNTYHEPISGLFRLMAPPDWDVRPNRIPFALQPNEVFASPSRSVSRSTRKPRSRRWSGSSRSTPTSVTGSSPPPGSSSASKTSMSTSTSIGWGAGDRAAVDDQPDQTVISFEGYVVAPARRRISRRFVNLLPGQNCPQGIRHRELPMTSSARKSESVWPNSRVRASGTASSPSPDSSGDPFSIAFSIVASGATGGGVPRIPTDCAVARWASGRRPARASGPPPQPPGAPSPQRWGSEFVVRFAAAVAGAVGHRTPAAHWSPLVTVTCGLASLLRCASIATAWPAGPTAVQLVREQFVRDHQRICGFGSRLAGQRGAELTADYLENEMKAAGIAWCWRQPLELVVPATESCTMRINDGPAVAAYPIWPNGANVSSTPASGSPAEAVYIGNGELGELPVGRLAGDGTVRGVR